MARHERARRLRVGHRVHADDAPLPRAPHRRAPGAARPHEHAEPPPRATWTCRTAPSRPRPRAGTPSEPPSPQSCSISPSSGSRWASPCGATSSARSSSRSACWCRTGRTRSTSPIGSSRRRGRWGSACARPSTSVRTNARSAIPSRAPTASRSWGTGTSCSLTRSSRGCVSGPTARRPSSASRATRSSTSCTPWSRAAATRPMGDLWSPGYFRMMLEPQGTGTIVASTEPWEVDRRPRSRDRAAGRAGSPAAACSPPPIPPPARARARSSSLAADQFVVTPAGRLADTALIRATGDEARTIIAGYHWFTDWGRDTMITLEGLTLLTGRHAGGRLHPSHLRALRPRRPDSQHVSRGHPRGPVPHRRRHPLVLPRDRPLSPRDGRSRHAPTPAAHAGLDRRPPPAGHAVRHRRGPRATGCCGRAQAGYQLTWMDAKVDDWVVTPRRGKAVEINALWYNALRLLEGWLRRGAGTGRGPTAVEPARTRSGPSFNARFWNADGGYLYDVIDGETGDDPACRPNQLFAISLAHPVLDEARWASVLDGGPGAPGHAGGAADPRPGPSRLQGDLRRRSSGSRRGLSPGHGLAVADRALRRRVASRAPRGPRAGTRISWIASGPTSTRRASAASARSSTRSPRSPLAAASLRPGAWPRCSARSS